MTAVITEAAIADGAEQDFTSPYRFDFTRVDDKVEVRAMVPMIGPILMGSFWEDRRVIAPGGSGKLLAIAEREWRALNAPRAWNP